MPFGFQPRSRPPHMRFTGIRGLPAPDHCRIPAHVPKIAELDGNFGGSCRVRGIAVERPCLGRGIEVGEQAVGGLLPRWAGGHRNGSGGGRAFDDVAGPLPIVQRQRVHQHDARDAVAHPFGHAANDHPAGAGADQDGVRQILEEQQIGHLIDEGAGVDARPQFVPAFGASHHGRRVDVVASGPQPADNALPDPAALVRAVHQNEVRHLCFPLMSTASRPPHPVRSTGRHRAPPVRTSHRRCVAGWQRHRAPQA